MPLEFIHREHGGEPLSDGKEVLPHLEADKSEIVNREEHKVNHGEHADDHVAFEGVATPVLAKKDEDDDDESHVREQRIAAGVKHHELNGSLHLLLSQTLDFFDVVFLPTVAFDGSCADHEFVDSLKPLVVEPTLLAFELPGLLGSFVLDKQEHKPEGKGEQGVLPPYCVG